MRRILLLLTLTACVAGCADDSGAFRPTPVPTPTPPAQAVVIYVLPPGQVPGYKRTADIVLNEKTLADQKGDAGLPNRLAADGFIHGARAEYAPPPSVSSSAFTAISSDALIFTAADGAGKYFVEESNRINTVPVGGTLDAIGGLPHRNVDDMLAFASSQPSPTVGAVDRAFIVLMRTGRVVTEIFASGGDATLTTAQAFLPLVTAEQTLLAKPPNG